MSKRKLVRKKSLLSGTAILVCTLLGPGCSSEEPEPVEAPGDEPAAFFTAAPPHPAKRPNVVQIPLPALPNARAVWGASGRDSRGHVWFGVSVSETSPCPSAHLLEYVPESGEVVDRGSVVEELRRGGIARTDEGQSKIHSKIIEGSDGHLYFTSMDMRGADFRQGRTPPSRGSHLWRLRLPDCRWEHLMAVPEGLIAISRGADWIYALGFFDHKLYQYDCKTGDVRSVVVGSVKGHISRNFMSDHRGHVYVPRLTYTTRSINPVVTLVEYDTDLDEVGEKPLEHYLDGLPGKSHGIIGTQNLADGSIAFLTHLGYLYRIVPWKGKPSELIPLGWFHPEGERYVASLFTYAGKRYLMGVATGDKDTHRDKTYEWVVYDLRNRRSMALPFEINSPNPPALCGSLLYGSMTRDNFGNFYVVGTDYDRACPLLFQVQASSQRSGSVRVILEPRNADEAGVRWRMRGGKWHQSGETASGVHLGEQMIEYKAVAIWEPPPDARVQIVSEKPLQITARCRPASEFVIDNKDDSDAKSFRCLRGKWRINTAGESRWPPGDQKGDYRYALTSASDETARAEWVHTCLPAGRYQVLAWWPVFEKYKLAQKTAYEIHHVGGVTTKRVDQTVNGGRWVSLGTYNFQAGNHRVQIHNGASSPGKYVVADAVKFISRP